MIPKIIHYCWFGRNPLPELALKCIESWKKFLPDYEIKEWNEDNIEFNFCSYVSEAYEMKKWAFVSDVVRLKVVYDYGGIYFDTDVEVIKSFDNLLNHTFFLGLESECRCNTGLGFGAEKGSLVIKEMLAQYQNEHFILSDGSINKLVCPIYNTNALLKLGVIFNPGIISFMGGAIYPTEYFCPKNYFTGELNITKNSYTVHHYDGSWQTRNQKVKHIIWKYFKFILQPVYNFIKGN